MPVGPYYTRRRRFRHVSVLPLPRRYPGMPDALAGCGHGHGLVDDPGAFTKNGTDHRVPLMVASRVAAAGVPREHIAHVLNHRSVTHATVTAIYGRYSYDREKRLALDIWAHALTAVLERKDDSTKVLPFAATGGRRP